MRPSRNSTKPSDSVRISPWRIAIAASDTTASRNARPSWRRLSILIRNRIPRPRASLPSRSRQGRISIAPGWMREGISTQRSVSRSRRRSGEPSSPRRRRTLQVPRMPWRRIASPRRSSTVIRRQEEPEKPEAGSPYTTNLPLVRSKLRELRTEAARIEKLVAKEEQQARKALADANAELQASYDALNNSRYLQQAKRSARAACEKGNYTNAESLEILAAIYASQCNFDRAEFYQKLAVIFASEDERPATVGDPGRLPQNGRTRHGEGKSRRPRLLPAGQGQRLAVNRAEGPSTPRMTTARNRIADQGGGAPKLGMVF